MIIAINCMNHTAPLHKGVNLRKEQNSPFFHIEGRFDPAFCLRPCEMQWVRPLLGLPQSGPR